MKEEKKYFYEMNSLALNVISLLLFIGIIIGTCLIGALNFSENDYKYILVLLLPYLVFHEILHSIGYVVNGAKFNRVTYGIHLEKGILCCSCKQEVKKHTILWSLIYPFLFIGIITYIIGIIYNNNILIWLSIMNISGCSRDLVMFFNFLRLKKFRFFEYDNPIAFGIVTDMDMEQIKMPYLNLIEEKDFKQTVGKKVSVSKTSIIMIIGYLLLCALYWII